jgi:hypothetical protein
MSKFAAVGGTLGFSNGQIPLLPLQGHVTV